jgi:hexosaminidase
MKSLLILLFFCSPLLAWPQTAALLPIPQKSEHHEGAWAIPDTLIVELYGPTSELKAYVDWIGTRLNQYQKIKVVMGKSILAASLSIEVKSEAALSLHMDESYLLHVRSDGLSINANTIWGAMRGLETMYQLIRSFGASAVIPAQVISDFPRFPWRGLMLDVSRHFISAEKIKAEIDAMAMLKLNVFHWHLSDDQGFRMESLEHPQLHQKGSGGQYYTQAEIKDIVAHARSRGIRVVPEFDLPGHFTSWLVAFPQLGSVQDTSYEIETRFGIFDPVLDPTRRPAYRFLDAFFEEVTTLFPDAFIHIGGDENTGKHWLANPEIQKFMERHKLDSAEALQNYFNQRLSSILHKHHRHMMGWDEIIHPDLPKTALIQSWRGNAYLFAAARQERAVLLSNGYYLDKMQPMGTFYRNDPHGNDTKLEEAYRPYVLGGEACLWSELISEETLDSRLWPAGFAVAERLWSAENVVDETSLLRRSLTLIFDFEEMEYDLNDYAGEILKPLTKNQTQAFALQKVVDYLSPLPGYERNYSLKKEGLYTTKYSLRQEADAARPNSKAALQFTLLTEEFLQSRDSLLRNKLLVLANDFVQLETLFKEDTINESISAWSNGLGTYGRVLYSLLKQTTITEESRQHLLQEIKKATVKDRACTLGIAAQMEKLVLNY